MYNYDSSLVQQLKNARTTNETAALYYPDIAKVFDAFIEDQLNPQDSHSLELRDLNDDFWALTLGILGNPEEPVVYVATESQFRHYQNGLYQPIHEATLTGLLLTGLEQCFATAPKSLRYSTTVPLKNRQRLKSVLERAKDLLAVDQSFFRDQQPYHMAFQNGVLNFDTMAFAPLSPTYPLRKTMPVKYEPDAKCDLFLSTFLAQVLSPEDIGLLQRYTSQVLEGINHTQSLLILCGDSGWGKSCLMRMLGQLVGWDDVGIVREQLFRNDLELSYYAHKHLLYHPDMPTSFLDRKEASIFKQLVGGDPIWASDMNQGRTTIHGQFPIVLACNGTPKIHLDHDTDAWLRRLAIIHFHTPKHEQHMGKFGDMIMRTEASGILNWLLEGRRKLQQDQLQLRQTPAQKQRAANLLMASESPSVFVRSCLVKKKGGVMGKADLYRHYEKWCRKMAIQPFLYKEFHQAAKPVIEVGLSLQLRHDLIGNNGKARRGWVGMGVADTKAVADVENESRTSVDTLAE
jgi:P4 family phage/plasmid primase-like protien